MPDEIAGTSKSYHKPDGECFIYQKGLGASSAACLGF